MVSPGGIGIRASTYAPRDYGLPSPSVSLSLSLSRSTLDESLPTTSKPHNGINQITNHYVNHTLTSRYDSTLEIIINTSSYFSSRISCVVGKQQLGNGIPGINDLFRRFSKCLNKTRFRLMERNFIHLIKHYSFYLKKYTI